MAVEWENQGIFADGLVSMDFLLDTVDRKVHRMNYINDTEQDAALRIIWKDDTVDPLTLVVTKNLRRDLALATDERPDLSRARYVQFLYPAPADAVNVSPDKKK